MVKRMQVIDYLKKAIHTTFKHKTLIIFLGILVLSACSGKQDDKAQVTTAESETQVLIDTKETLPLDGVLYENQVSLGDTVQSELCEFVFEKTKCTYDLLPVGNPNIQTMYRGAEGKYYFFFEGHIKNTWTKAIDPSNTIAKLVFDDTYEYSADIYIENGEMMDKNNSITPFEEARIVLAGQVPEELLKQYKNAKAVWGLAEDMESFAVDWDDCKQIYVIDSGTQESVYDRAVKLVKDDKYTEASDLIADNEFALNDYQSASLTYCHGRISEHNKIYGRAIQLFEKAGDFEDAKARKAALADFISPLNGMYFRPATDEIGMGMYLSIRDGYVAEVWDNYELISSKEQTVNYLHSLAELEIEGSEGEYLFGFGGFFDDNPDKESLDYVFLNASSVDGDAYKFDPQNFEKFILTKFETNPYDTLAGTYEKVSDAYLIRESVLGSPLDAAIEDCEELDHNSEINSSETANTSGNCEEVGHTTDCGICERCGELIGQEIINDLLNTCSKMMRAYPPDHEAEVSMVLNRNEWTLEEVAAAASQDFDYYQNNAKDIEAILEKCGNYEFLDPIRENAQKALEAVPKTRPEATEKSLSDFINGLESFLNAEADLAQSISALARKAADAIDN